MASIQSILTQTSLDPIDARILLHHACHEHLGWTRAHMISQRDEDLPQEVIATWLSLETNRLVGHPVAYLIGKKAFFDIELYVNEAVLIPRPETELLVETTIALLDRILAISTEPIAVLDLGTGSGAIVLSIAHFYQSHPQFSQMRFVGVDISDSALQVAQRNAHRLAIPQIEWVQSDWFEQIPEQLFDVIVSNPPYISAKDEHLTRGDLRFEPQQALTDGADGLLAYRTIALHTPAYLKSFGSVLFEHGYDQRQDIINIFLTNGFPSPTAFQDSNRLDRVLCFQNIDLCTINSQKR